MTLSFELYDEESRVVIASLEARKIPHKQRSDFFGNFQSDNQAHGITVQPQRNALHEGEAQKRFVALLTIDTPTIKLKGVVQTIQMLHRVLLKL